MDKQDVVNIHDGLLLSYKKEQNNAICSNMDALILSEGSPKEKDKFHMMSLIFGI